MEKFKQTDDFEQIAKDSYYRISGIIKKCYDKDQQALFGSSTHRSSIYYTYIPAEFMEEGIPFIISSGVSYDGGKEQDKAVAEGAMLLTYKELPLVFRNNTFQQ